MSHDSYIKKNTHGIVGYNYWTMDGCKGETAQLYVLH